MDYLDLTDNITITENTIFRDGRGVVTGAYHTSVGIVDGDIFVAPCLKVLK